LEAGGGWSGNVEIYQFVSINIASSCSMEKLFIKEIGIQGSIDLIDISLFWPGLRTNIFKLHLNAKGFVCFDYYLFLMLARYEISRVGCQYLFLRFCDIDFNAYNFPKRFLFFSKLKLDLMLARVVWSLNLNINAHKLS
jgi:hypothetical protein